MAGQILTRSMTNALHAPTGLTNLDHTFTVNGLDQYLTGAGVTFTHDARGSLTYDGTRTYAYDFDNRLTNVTGVGGAVALTYDPAGRLYQTAQTGGATTRFMRPDDRLASSRVDVFRICSWILAAHFAAQLATRKLALSLFYRQLSTLSLSVAGLPLRQFQSQTLSDALRGPDLSQVSKGFAESDRTSETYAAQDCGL